MRASRTLPILLLSVVSLGLAACGGDDGEGASTDGAQLTAAEQRYADALAADLQDDEDGFGVTASEAACMGDAILEVLGTAPFEEAGIEPDDFSGDESPGELLGTGTVSDADASSIADAWEDCTDLALAFATAASSDFDLDDEGIDCFADGLRGSDALTSIVEQTFTSAEEDPGGEVLTEIVGLVQECSVGEGGEGGLLVQSIADSIQQDSGLSRDDATCIAQHAVDSIGADRLVELSSGTDDFEDAPAEVQNEMAEAIVDAAAACGVPIASLGG
jgi:hypothetical protein